MDASNVVAHELESYGVRTFSAKEMAFNILGLMHPLLFSITQVEPIWADLNGGMDRLPDLADITTRIRLSLNKKSDLRRAIARDNSADFKIINGLEAERILQTVNVTPRANFRFDFPTLEPSESLANVAKLRGMVDLDKVIVITGFAEVGPWGSSRTRWEMEARGEFTIEGCIEMAWMMGYIKHFDGRLKDGSLYVGWVDSKSGEPVDDKDVRGHYEKSILTHAGVRLIGEPHFLSAAVVFILIALQNLNCSTVTIRTRRFSTKRSSSSTTWNPSKSLKLKPRSSSMSMATSVMSGQARAASGLSNSRGALVFWSPRHSSLVAPSPARFRLAGMLVGMVSPLISSHKRIARPYGLLSALQKLSTNRASPILTNYTSICTRPTWAQVSAVVWEAPRVLPKCSRIVGTRRRSRMTCFRRRELSLFVLCSTYLTIKSFKLHQHDRWLGQFVAHFIQWSGQDSSWCMVRIIIPIIVAEANRYSHSARRPYNLLKSHAIPYCPVKPKS